MNVYDFDKTIYGGDSTLDFYFYCLKETPRLIRCLPAQVRGAAGYLLKRKSKTQFKEDFFSFLKHTECTDRLIDDFWKEHEKKIKKWYLDQKSGDDVVVSASPSFLLEPICGKLGIRHIIASRVDVNTGIFADSNCYGEEKARRFRERFPNTQADNVYSDSMSDYPLFAIGKNTFLVKGDTVKKIQIQPGGPR